MKRLCISVVVLGMALALGCEQRPLTHTSRGAIEQLVLTGAVDDALDKFEMRQLRRKKVFVDCQYVDGTDAPYVKMATRVRVGELGAVLVESADEADYVLQIARGALGTEYKSSVVGLPAMPVPNSPVATPEAPAWSSGKLTGIAKLFIAVYEQGKLVEAYHYYDKCIWEEANVMGKRYSPQDEIREEWEEAEQKLNYDKKGKGGSAQE